MCVRERELRVGETMKLEVSSRSFIHLLNPHRVMVVTGVPMVGVITFLLRPPPLVSVSFLARPRPRFWEGGETTCTEVVHVHERTCGPSFDEETLPTSSST